MTDMNQLNINKSLIFKCQKQKSKIDFEWQKFKKKSYDKFGDS